MEITDEIKQEEVFDEEKQEDIFYTLLNGKNVKETITTSRGKFVVRFPKQKDLLAIDRRVALMRGGIPAVNFDEAANFALQKVAYLDVVIESGDNWFNNLKQKRNFSWGDMPDTSFIDEVYVKAWSFRNKVQALFAEDEGKSDKSTSEQEKFSEAVGNDLFSGIAASAKRD